MDLWPHQQHGIDAVLAAISEGKRRILLACPTGAGKTEIARRLIEHYLDLGRTASIYTNRKMLLEQLSDVFTAAGVQHGIRAAGYDDEADLPVQIASFQTEWARTPQAIANRLKKKGVPDAIALEIGRQRAAEPQQSALVVIDEAHLHRGARATGIITAHAQKGAVILGMTATPVDLWRQYEVLIQAGTNSELRECGALVNAVHYHCDSPDMKKVKQVLGEDLSPAENRKAIMRKGVFGRVVEWWRKLNPQQRPTILFGPGAGESLWFAQQFFAAGIPAAHIDGEEVWINGETCEATAANRRRLADASRSGAVRVVCNRFVCREGIDWPWLGHCILATVFGSLSSYLQTGGRVLRAYPGLESVVIQDHGANCFRFGSLNADRLWRLEYTGAAVVGIRQDAIREGRQRPPFACPGCSRILTQKRCPGCGHEVTSYTQPRSVVQVDGELRQLKGDLFPPRRVSQRPDGPAIWKRMYYRSRTEKGARTFAAAMALFARENQWGWPNRDWPYMPVNPEDIYRKVADVPMSDLKGVPAKYLEGANL